MHEATITSLFRYPVKSARGLAVNRSVVLRTGLAGDRQWLIVDGTGNFVTQRQKAELATIAVTEVEFGLVLTCRDQSLELHSDRIKARAVTREVTVWNDRVAAFDAGDDAAAFLAETIGENRGRPLRLVLVKEHRTKLIRNAPSQDLNGQTVPIAFTDGYPFLITTVASLTELQQRIERNHPGEGSAITSRRFRPNIVLDAVAAHAEDQIDFIETRSGLRIRLVKPCARCVIPMGDPETGVRGPEPMRTLRAYRSQKNGIMFGQNAILTAGEGETISVGDKVRIEYRS